MRNCSTANLPWHSKAYCDHDDGLIVIADGSNILRCLIAQDDCAFIGDDEFFILTELHNGPLATIEQCKQALFKIYSILKNNYYLDELPRFDPNCNTVKSIPIYEILPCSERSIVRHGSFRKATTESIAEGISAMVVNSATFIAICLSS